MASILKKLSRCRAHLIRIQKIADSLSSRNNSEAICSEWTKACCRYRFCHSSSPSETEAEKRDKGSDVEYFKNLAIHLHSREELQNVEKAFNEHLSSQPGLQLSASASTAPPVDDNIPKFHLSTNENVEKHSDDMCQDLVVGDFFGSVDPLAEGTVHLSDVPTQFPNSFNLAAYVNKSSSLQQLVLLGVDIYRWDSKRDICSFILKLDFDRDMKRYIQFLHDNGVSTSDIGKVLTKIPLIFKTPLEDLQVRVNYLQSKKFSTEAIGRIITKAPMFLLFSTKWIDQRLGYFQKKFQLSGDEVRHVVTRMPKVVLQNIRTLTEKHFSIAEQMGFKPDEVKHLLLHSPKVWLLENKSLLERFHYFHNEMGISHQLILQFPGALLKRKLYVKQRHLFLKAVNRAQYDPTQENYVSLRAMVGGSDADFCRETAKTSLKNFNDFLKTL